MRTRMRMIASVASVALITATAGAAAASASSASPSPSSPTPVKSSGGAGDPGGKTPPSGSCGGVTGSGGKSAPAPGTPDPQISHALAAILGISDAQAAQVLERLDRIARPGNGISPTDPQFAAIATSLHITAQRLAQALDQMKRDLSQAAPAPSGSSPASPPSSGKS